LKRKHGANLRTVKNVQEKRFDDVVLMMPESNLVTSQPMGQMEEQLSPFPRAEEAGVLSILAAIRLFPDVSKLDMIGEVTGFEKILEDLGSSGFKTQIDVNRD
jgi:hypothetical protein